MTADRGWQKNKMADDQKTSMPHDKTNRVLNPFVVALLVFGVALIGYEIYRDQARRAEDAKQEARMEQLAQQTSALKQQAERLREQAAKLGEQTNAMQQQVQDEQRAAEEAKQRFIGAANIAEGIQASSFAKPAIVDFYMSEGRWPSSNADIGMQAPDKFSGHSLRSMAVSAGGVITLTYDEKSGVDRGVVQLIPDASNPQLGIKWRCVTPTYANIATIMPNCEYRLDDEK